MGNNTLKFGRGRNAYTLTVVGCLHVIDEYISIDRADFQDISVQSSLYLAFRNRSYPFVILFLHPCSLLECYLKFPILGIKSFLLM